MSAHFDGGEEIAGRRLREVEVTYVDDPTLDMGAEDSDDCPASPPPTYYLRVREERKKRPAVGAGNAAATDGSGSCGCRMDSGGVVQVNFPRLSVGIPGRASGRFVQRGSRSQNKENSSKAWSWRYVNVEKKALLVWDRRGGRLLRSIPLMDVESLLVLPDEHAPASILEVYVSPAEHANAGRDQSSNDNADGESNQETEEGEAGNVLVLQARSRRETFLWAKVLQENVELMTKRRIPLENRDEETSLSDVQQVG
ncbi:unnamed protein product [Scytosiphon promiscuus]